MKVLWVNVANSPVPPERRGRGVIAVARRPIPGDTTWIGPACQGGMHYATGCAAAYAGPWNKAGAMLIREVNDQQVRTIMASYLMIGNAAFGHPGDYPPRLPNIADVASLFGLPYGHADAEEDEKEDGLVG